MDEKEDDAAVSSSATAFQSALNRFKKSLTPQQRQDFAICTVSDVNKAIETIQDRLGSQRRMRNMAKLSKFVEAMTQLGKVVEVFLNVEGTVAFVWAASTYTESLDVLLDTYAEVGDILPQLTRYENLLEKHPELRKYVESYYCDVLDFHRKALEVFSRPAWKAVFHSAWKTFKTKFGPVLSNLKRHRDLISDEKLSIAISEVTDMRTSVEDKLDAMSRRIAEIKADEDQDRELRARNTNYRKRKHLLDILDPPNHRSDFDRACDQHETSSSQEWIFRHALVETKISKKFKLREEDTVQIISRVTGQAEGMFLYAKIVLDNLASQTSKRLVQQEMQTENFPQGLNEAYERVVARVLDGTPRPQKQAAREMLGLIVCAERPLMWREIQSKFCIDLASESADVDLQLSPSSCKHFCSSLVEADSTSGLETDPDSKILLVHDSARIMEIRASDIRQHTITGYYGFLDYAGACWWKHAIKMAGDHRSLNKSLLDETFETIARAMNSYRTPEASEKGERYSAENIESFLPRMTQDEWEWEAQFKMQDRVHKIRTVIERLVEHHGHEEAYLPLVPLYGALRYKCSKPWCRWFFYGFDALEAREEHLREHERPFRCLVEGCYGSDIGFATESGLNRHDRRFHCGPTVDFPSLRPSKEKTDSLHDAIEKDDLLTVKSLVSQGTDMNKRRYPTGMTPLQLAIHKGNIAICQYLLDSGTDINRPMLGSSRFTVLHLAVQVDDADITYPLLCQPEVDPSALDSNFRTPFDLATLLGARNALSAFVAKWPPLKDIALLESSAMPKLDEDWSAMSMYSSVALIMSLVQDSSSDLNAVQETLGQSPLSCLVEHNMVELVEELLSTGRVDLRQSSRNAISTIKQAISTQNPQMVSLIMSQFSDKLLDQSPADLYALLMAAGRSNEAVRSALFHPQLPAWKDSSPLHITTCLCSVDLTRELLRAGSDPNVCLGRFRPRWVNWASGASFDVSSENAFREASRCLKRPLIIAFFLAALSENRRPGYLEIAQLLLGCEDMDLPCLSQEERLCLLAMVAVTVPHYDATVEFRSILFQLARLGFSLPRAAIRCGNNPKTGPYLALPALSPHNFGVTEVENIRWLAIRAAGAFLEAIQGNYPFARWMLVYGGSEAGNLEFGDAELDALLRLAERRNDVGFLEELYRLGLDKDESFLRAVRQGRGKLLDLLLQTGQILLLECKNGRSLMGIGLSEGNREVVERLIEERRKLLRPDSKL
ncbi:hypothetical protein DL768_007810 [Monosporascus sp. mg162]|nr:hypothetical protein DL768_007810 [Monosporascus sp. mg162]